jgi:3-methylcrotonyl-CoA carboxylase alpha subunit
VSPYYDSLIAKLICFGADRDQARARMVAALGEFSLLGITNTAAFLRDVVASAAFARADLSTRFLEVNFPHWADADLTTALITAALVADGIISSATRAGLAAANGTRADAGVSDARSPWTELAGFELWNKR